MDRSATSPIRSGAPGAAPAAVLTDRLVADPVVVLDTVLDEIDADIADHPPERGGALLGFPLLGVITDVIHDRWATTTAASYRPSLLGREGHDSLEATVHLVETTTAQRFDGYVHSHPGGLDRPSSQDLVAFADTSRLNPALASLEVPIVTDAATAADLGPHEARLPSGKISWYSVVRNDDGALVCAPRRLVVSPLGQDLDTLATTLGAAVDLPGWQPTTTLDGVRALRARLALPTGTTVELRVCPHRYPADAPTVVVTDMSGQRHPVELRWGKDVTRAQVIADAVNAVLAHHAGPAREAAAVVGERVDVAAGLRARLDGIVPPSIRAARVSVFGLGSGGSQIVEMHVRAGVEHFDLVDDDRVEVENLSRSTYTFDDVGSFKTDALARHIRAINPDANVETHVSTVQDLPATVLGHLTSTASLVIGATDDPAAQALVNLHAFRAGTPAVYGGVYELGRGGEAVLAIPGVTPCYRCATAIRHSGSRHLLGGHDYGLRPGRLTGAPALGADISHVATAAAKIGLAILAADDPDSPLVTEFLAPSMAQGGNRTASFVQLATVADYSYFPRVFDGVAGQGAWQTVWLTVHPDPDCPICGDDAVHIAPPPPTERAVTLDEIAAARANVHPPDEETAP